MESVIAEKIGMTQIFDESGKLLGVTVVEAVGDQKVDIFKVGDVVKISGRSIGKGFQGTIKRFHDHRGPMSHGSKSHRIPGSIGSGTTPGRVWKGRNMPGRMGGGRVTVKNIVVTQVIAEKKLLLLHGPVPGKRGNQVLIGKV
ncbi:50S ribosomal protein L3 [Candidatus Saganbacteria bacterium]|uniref:Large ribosomal subunit protein uL3 n=1 Tax=Candidatus Saganbacteria bacterium TaxID=2575572 RepID=A0A9D6YW29_UNCSA|nr:50S ribosomal protein L3 [Candidatus Saganbacteria bacterium]